MMAATNRSPFEAFKEEHEMYPDYKAFRHSLSIEIPVIDKKNDNGNSTNVPEILSFAFTKLLSTDTNTTIETCNKQIIGSAEDILVEKKQFDEQFKCEIRTVGEVYYVKTYFIVKTKRTFGKLKDDIWSFLKTHSLWLKRAPGPPGTTNLKALGMLSNVPRFASLVSVNRDIHNIIFQASVAAEESGAHDYLQKREELGLEETEILNVHIQRAKVTGKIGEKTIADTQAVVVYSEKDDAPKNAILLEAYSRGLTILNMKYIPFGLRRSDEETFGRLLHESMVKQQATRNMAIYGVSPEMMDYGRTAINGNFPEQESLWDQLYNIKGILRVDPHMRTADLGKWHLSVENDLYDEIGRSVDIILENIQEMTPANIHKPYMEFPLPTRMKTITGTIYKGKSDSSNKYRSWLTADVTVASTITKITETPIKRKRVNIEAISYCAAATASSPISPSTPNNKSTSSLSTLTEDTVQAMIHSSIQKAMQELNEKHEQDMATLNNKFDMFQTTAVKGVIDALTGENSTLATKSDLNKKIDALHSTIDSIKQLIINTNNPPTVGNRKSKRKTATQNLKDTDSDMSDL